MYVAIAQVFNPLTKDTTLLPICTIKEVVREIALSRLEKILKGAKMDPIRLGLNGNQDFRWRNTFFCLREIAEEDDLNVFLHRVESAQANVDQRLVNDFTSAI